MRVNYSSETITHMLVIPLRISLPVDGNGALLLGTVEENKLSQVSVFIDRSYALLYSKQVIIHTDAEDREATLKGEVEVECNTLLRLEHDCIRDVLDWCI